jgi:hypothetical protein
MAISWAANLLHFHLNKLFKNMVCILALLGFGYFSKNWAIFAPKSSSHPVSRTNFTNVNDPKRARLSAVFKHQPTGGRNWKLISPIFFPRLRNFF